MIPPSRIWTRDEMMKRIAFFGDLRGSKSGLPDSDVPGCEKELINVIGFKAPDDGGDHVSPVGSDSAKTAAIDIYEGFNLGYVRCRPGNGPLMHNHDTSETFIPMTGRWRCHWNEGAAYEYVDAGPCDVVSFPPGVMRRFSCIEAPEGEETALMMFVIGGEAPQVEFSEAARSVIASAGVSQSA